MIRSKQPARMRVGRKSHGNEFQIIETDGIEVTLDLRIAEAGSSGEVCIEDPTAHLFAHPTNVAFDGGTLCTANLGRRHMTRIETDTAGEPPWQSSDRRRAT